jgi:hypothetical protein
VSEAERTHGPPCTAGKDGGPCTRCTGFLPGHEHRVGEGNDLAVKHGVYAVLQLTPRADELAGKLRGLADHLTPADEPALQTLALLLAQLERVAGVLGEVDDAVKRGADVDVYLGRVERRSRLSADMRGWAKEGRNLLHELGLTPAGRRDLEAERTLMVVHQLHPILVAFVVSLAELVPPERRGELDARFEELEGELRALEPGAG